MPSPSTSPADIGPRRWAWAALALGLALLLRWALQPMLGDRMPLVTLYGAVAVAVWVAGALPAVAVALLGFIAARQWFMPDSWFAQGWGPLELAAAGGYAFSAGLIVLFGHALHRARRRLVREVEQRRAAEEACETERRRLAITLASIPDGVLVSDAEDRIVSTNAEASRLTGWSVAQSIGRPLGEVFDVEFDHVAAPASPGPQPPQSGRLRRREGEAAAVAIEASVAPIFDEGGRRVGAVRVFRDVGALRESERRLLQAHEALYVVVQSSPLGVVVLDHEPAVVRLWNGAAERLFGLSASEAVDRPLAVVPPEAEAAFAEQIEQVRRGVVLSDAQASLARADGRSVEVRMSAAPLADTSGRVTGSLLLFADITDRVQIEASLRRTDATLRAFFDNAPAGLGVVSLTDDGDILHLHDNPVSCRIFGVPPGATENRRASELGATPEMIALWRTHYQRSATLGVPLVFEYSQAMQGQTMRYRATVCAVDPGTDAAARYCYMAEDITERKQAEDALAEADRRKDEFIATLAHELRNPLAPLRNGVHLLRVLSGANAAVEKPLSIMERQIAHMVRLIDDLLDVARVSGGKLELQRHRIDAADAVREAVETSQPLIQAAGHRLTISLPPEPLFIDADVTRVCQVVANLLNNAAKYTPQQGRVRVSLEPDGEWARISVEDDGRGIAADMLPRVFEMFTQVDRTLDRSRGGLGIGLAIARKLVLMHGGELEASSRGPGQGSRFVVRLPLAAPVGEGALAPPRIVTTDARGHTRTALRVLIADDNIDAADSLNTIVRLRGHDTRVAHDGLDALQRAETFRPQLALLDIGMPGLDGHDLARRLRTEPWGRAMRLVAVSGWGQERDQAASIAAGFDEHWVKPVDPAALDALLEGIEQAPAAVAEPAVRED
ncbi:MAG TPA: PAS domain S-box protein [Methylibium sp.]|uniref:hybrid sensor histidine kinase/response regulator n=1 Tax=Methylibium sp. TaxID=2067992 RepID=UPI002DBE63F9|nr:PAS domain S-box protein [Methylibium sp.]HEU4459125.1 PAS domain S-box protein [Methylibium sp.]